MPADYLEIADFLVQRDTCPVVDVRSPGEFHRGHIPQASNLPLLDDAERCEIGTLYKRSGRAAAIARGHELVDPKIESMVAGFQQLAPDGRLLLHCWRGGLRSEAVAQLLRERGLSPQTLKGGYRAYRRDVHQRLGMKRPLVVLGGLTGTGKTEVLGELRALGEQVVDLEQLASHRGSAFGALGRPAQPTVEHFENQLAELWSGFDPGRLVWIEDESRKIGRVVIPEPIWAQMRAAPVIRIAVEREARVHFLVEQYGDLPLPGLLQATESIQKRLGPQRLQLATRALHAGDLCDFVRIVLEYYDQAYSRSAQKYPRDRECVFVMKVPVETGRIEPLRQLGYDLAQAMPQTGFPPKPCVSA
ncbi:MAG: tRNA 2-selenouridine(34) synthase MnmH [Planctomycetota bacterium]